MASCVSDPSLLLNSVRFQPPFFASKALSLKIDPVQSQKKKKKEKKNESRSYLTISSSYSESSLSRSRNYRDDDGIVIVDHGSRRTQSNTMLDEFVDMFKKKTGHLNVEPAHMELAKPSIKEAFTKCVSKGATRIIIFPYFLSPGRHWDKDIPALALEAASEHPNISYIVTAPIGLHALMVDILQDRINYCLHQASGEVSECKICMGTGRCKILESS